MPKTSENALVVLCGLFVFVSACKTTERGKGTPDSSRKGRKIGDAEAVDSRTHSSRDGLVEKPGSTESTGAVEREACNFQFDNQPSWIERPYDPFVSAMMLADMNQDGTNDLILASGGDVRKGHVAIVYTARAGEVAPAPWISTTVANYTGLSVGDINSDGRPDIVASIYDCPEIRGCQVDDLVAAQIFLTDGQMRPKSPQQQLTGFRSRGVDLGDLNGDGTLDVALAVIDFQPSQQRVYFNRGVDIETKHPWVSTSKHLGASVTTLDLNLDGLLDVLYTGQTPDWGVVFYGHIRENEISLPQRGELLKWNSGQGTVLALASDYFRTKQNSKELRLSIAFSSHYCQESRCDAPVALTSPSTNGFVWQGATTGLAAVVRSADIDRDGDMDLVVGSWIDPKDRPRPGPLTIFCGRKGSEFNPKSENLGQSKPNDCRKASCAESPGACPSCFLSQSVMLGNLHRDRLETRLYTETLAEGRSTISLPDRLVDRVLEVRRSDSPIENSRFRFVPGSNNVQVVSDFNRSFAISVCYQVVVSPDIFVADANNPDRIPIFAQIHRKIGKSNDKKRAATRNTEIDQPLLQKSCAELYREKRSRTQ